MRARVPLSSMQFWVFLFFLSLEGATKADYTDLASELKILIHVGEHKNIVNILGACTRGRRLMVIIEFAPHGDLLAFLRERRDIYEANWAKTSHNPGQELTLVDLVMMAYSISQGMEFLASKRVRTMLSLNLWQCTESAALTQYFHMRRITWKKESCEQRRYWAIFTVLGSNMSKLTWYNFAQLKSLKVPGNWKLVFKGTWKALENMKPQNYCCSLYVVFKRFTLKWGPPENIQRWLFKI